MLETFDYLVVTSPENSALEKGLKMWECIDALALHYENVDMSKISPTSKFSDDTWDAYGDATFNFLWSKWLPKSNQYPLLLVCKIVVYFNMQIKNLEASSIRSSVAQFITSFDEAFESKSILIAERNQPFQNLSYLGQLDILLVAQIKFARSGTMSPDPYRGLNYLCKISTSFFPNAEFLIEGSTTSLPWGNSSVSQWVINNKESEQKRQLNPEGTPIFFDNSVKSYASLEPEVVELLIQSIMPFFNEHFKLIETVFNDIEKLSQEHEPKKKGVKMNMDVRIKITKKYKIKLNKILPLRYRDVSGTKVITDDWFTEFEWLIQGAVAWLILLTTGLRNVDMRNLVKGCCQPSQRYDLINYLVTDIKKTNMVNYIIPVPPIVAKAVQLAAIAKINRAGDMLFNQRQETQSDNTSADKKKIKASFTFNTMIKDFAAHFDIRLNTVREDDDSEGTAHCVRATLAGYIGANSHAAIIILKRLFGHSNNLMPDAYLVNNPIIIKQRQKNITDAQAQQASIMSKNIIRGKVSGTKGKQMLEGLKHIAGELRLKLRNESLTEMDFHIRLEERLKEILLMRIQGEDIYALKTPVGVICMRSQSDSTDSPCAKLSNHQKRKELNISKDVTDALATLPNPAQCVGKECSDALLGEDWSRDLLYSFDFYIKLLKGQGHKNIDIRHQAKHYINDYGPLLKDIYADEREETYFD